MFTTRRGRPRSRSRNHGATARKPLNAPRRTTSWTSCHSASVIRCTIAARVIPALLTRWVRSPKRSAAACAAAAKLSGSATSTATPAADEPAVSSSAASRAAPSASRSATQTAAPSRASLRAIASPSPRAPPVTSATAPSSGRSAADAELIEHPLAQWALLDLRSRHRPLLDEPQVSRDLEAGDPLPAVVEQLLLRRRGAGAQLDERHGDLLEARVRDADDLDQLDRGVRGEVRLDLRRGDVLAAHLEHLLEAAEEPQPARLVERAAVARVQPALLVERGRRLLRVVVVALAQAEAAHEDLLLGGDPHLDAGQRGAARRDPRLEAVVRAGVGDGAAALGQAVERELRRLRHRGLHLAQHVGRRDVDEDPPGPEVGRGVARVGQEP